MTRNFRLLAVSSRKKRGLLPGKSSEVYENGWNMCICVFTSYPLEKFTRTGSQLQQKFHTYSLFIFTHCCRITPIPFIEVKSKDISLSVYLQKRYQRKISLTWPFPHRNQAAQWPVELWNYFIDSAVMPLSLALLGILVLNKLD